MKSLRHFLLLIILIAAGRTQAQDTLQISSNLNSIASSVVLGNTDSVSNPVITITLTNVGNTTFNDTISFGCTINNVYYPSTISDSSGLNFTPFHSNIAPHDTVQFSIVIHFNRPDFVVGSSTVVIWPITNHTSLVMLDSLHQAVTITAPVTGITDPELNALKVYTSRQVLFVKNMSENSTGDIRIYSMDGALISSQKLSQYLQIPMGQYTEGIYMVEINLGDGKKAVYKVANVKDR